MARVRSQIRVSKHYLAAIKTNRKERQLPPNWSALICKRKFIQFTRDKSYPTDVHVMDFSVDDTERRQAQTVVRFHDYDGEVLVELENAPVPQTGETVTLRALRMMEGPPNPDLVALDDPQTTWESQDIEREVAETSYEIRWLEYPDKTAQLATANVTVVDVYLARIED